MLMLKMVAAVMCVAAGIVLIFMSRPLMSVWCMMIFLQTILISRVKPFDIHMRYVDIRPEIVNSHISFVI